MSQIIAEPATVPLVIFSLEGNSHAVATAQVQEVVRMVAMSAIPGAPAWVAGRVNFRGRPIVVIDLRQRLGFPASDYGLATPIIIARTSTGETVGLVADVIDHLDDLPREDVFPAADSGLVSAVARVGATLINVLDIDAVAAGADRLPGR